MQAVTALAHLRACALYFMDISEQCGHSLEEQVNHLTNTHILSSRWYFNTFNKFKVALFDSIRPLFSNKPLVVVINKIDVIRLEDLPEHKQNILKEFAERIKGRGTTNLE